MNALAQTEWARNTNMTLVGTGDNAVVYRTKRGIAKVVFTQDKDGKFLESVEAEYNTQEILHSLNAQFAPRPIQLTRLEGDDKPEGYEAILIEMEELTQIKEITPQLVDQIKKIIKKLVHAGYLHNDLHWGNLMMRNKSVVLIDFGFTRKLLPESVSQIKKDTGLCDLVCASELYALFDMCNRNNVKNEYDAILQYKHREITDSATFKFLRKTLKPKQSEWDVNAMNLHMDWDEVYNSWHFRQLKTKQTLGEESWIAILNDEHLYNAIHISQVAALFVNYMKNTQSLVTMENKCGDNSVDHEIERTRQGLKKFKKTRDRRRSQSPQGRRTRSRIA